MQISLNKPLEVFKKSLKLMGNRFEICVVHPEKEEAHKLIDLAIGEIGRIERLLTTFNDNSVTAEINRNAGIKPVEIPVEVFQLLERSVKISNLTQGAFDITYGSIDKRLWNFDTAMTSLPDKETARKLVRLINYRNILLNKEEYTVMLKEAGMRIGFGGIGKGYAADKAKHILQMNGVSAGYVNASGDLVTWGRQPNEEQWTVGIADPDQDRAVFSSLNISNLAIATSGNYEKFAVINGKKYSHTIDPKTGFPVGGIKSVSIICPSAELADALATPVMVMGIKPGLNMLNQMNNIASIIVNDENKVFTTRNINLV